MKFKNLKILRMSGNRIRELPDSLFINLKNLQELYLSDNKIK